MLIQIVFRSQTRLTLKLRQCSATLPVTTSRYDDNINSVGITLLNVLCKVCEKVKYAIGFQMDTRKDAEQKIH